MIDYYVDIKNPWLKFKLMKLLIWLIPMNFHQIKHNPVQMESSIFHPIPMDFDFLFWFILGGPIWAS